MVLRASGELTGAPRGSPGAGAPSDLPVRRLCWPTVLCRPTVSGELRREDGRSSSVGTVSGDTRWRDDGDRTLIGALMRRQRPLWPHPNRRMIVLESVGAVLALVTAITWAVLGAPWIGWTLMLVLSASSAVAAWVQWRSGR